MEKENNEIQKNKSNSIPIILIISILIILLGFGYALGGTNIVIKVHKQNKEEKTEKKETKTIKDLDTKSRLVQYLYNEVTYDLEEPSCFKIWEYENKDEDKVKMNILGKNINTRNGHRIMTTQIPAYKDYGTGTVEGEVVSYYFTLNEIERIYKMIYGKDAKIDTSKDITISKAGSIYHYDSNTQRYYPYYILGGAVCGGIGEKAILSKAVQSNNTIKIYQDVVYVEGENQQTKEEYKYVYTFEKEEDGMYKFIGRTKEK